MDELIQALCAGISDPIAATVLDLARALEPMARADGGVEVIRARALLEKRRTVQTFNSSTASLFKVLGSDVEPLNLERLNKANRR